MITEDTDGDTKTQIEERRRERRHEDMNVAQIMHHHVTNWYHTSFQNSEQIRSTNSNKDWKRDFSNRFETQKQIDKDSKTIFINIEWTDLRINSRLFTWLNSLSQWKIGTVKFIVNTIHNKSSTYEPFTLPHSNTDIVFCPYTDISPIRHNKLQKILSREASRVVKYFQISNLSVYCNSGHQLNSTESWIVRTLSAGLYLVIFGEGPLLKPSGVFLHSWSFWFYYWISKLGKRYIVWTILSFLSHSFFFACSIS